MATCYVMRYGRDEALARARERIARYNEAQGGKNTADAGYHETLTVFWINRVADAIPAGASRLNAVKFVVEMLGSRRDLWREYYTFDLVKSREARAKYVAPDRSAAEFSAME